MSESLAHRLIRRVLGELPDQVAVLAAVAFAVAVGFGIVAPVITLFASEFGVGMAAAGAVVSAFALMRLASSLAGGRLVDRFGEQRLIAVGLAVVAITSLASGLAQSYAQLLVFRGLGGIGSAMFTVAAVTLLLRIVSSDQRGRANTWFQGGFLLGGLAGPAIGGMLAAISLRAPFFVYAATLAVAMLITMIALRHTQAADADGDGQPTQRMSLAAAFREPAYRVALVANLGTGWVLFGVRSSLVPLFVADALGRSAFWVGVGFVVGSAVQATALVPAGRFVDKVGRKPAIIAGGLLATASMVVLVSIQTLPGFLAAMVCYGAAAALMGVAPAAVVGDIVRGRGGTVVAAYQMAADIGAIVGPLLAGWLADDVGYGAAFGVGALILAGSALLAMGMPETRRDTTLETT